MMRVIQIYVPAYAIGYSTNKEEQTLKRCRQTQPEHQIDIMRDAWIARLL